MKELPQFILAVLIGFSILILSLGYISNQKSAQKIKNIEKLYLLKTSLETDLTIQETEEMIREVEEMADSINKIK